MRLRLAGTLAKWFAAAAAGMLGPFLIWSLLASSLHPTSLGEQPRAPVSVALTDPTPAAADSPAGAIPSVSGSEPSPPVEPSAQPIRQGAIPVVALVPEPKPVENAPSTPPVDTTPAPTEDAPPADEESAD